MVGLEENGVFLWYNLKHAPCLFIFFFFFFFFPSFVYLFVYFPFPLSLSLPHAGLILGVYQGTADLPAEWVSGAFALPSAYSVHTSLTREKCTQMSQPYCNLTREQRRRRLTHFAHLLTFLHKKGGLQLYLQSIRSREKNDIGREVRLPGQGSPQQQQQVFASCSACFSQLGEYLFVKKKSVRFPSTACLPTGD